MGRCRYRAPISVRGRGISLISASVGSAAISAVRETMIELVNSTPTGPASPAAQPLTNTAIFWREAGRSRALDEGHGRASSPRRRGRKLQIAPCRSQIGAMARRISRTLFDLLAIGTRRAVARAMTTEVSWWSDLNDQIIGTVFIDAVDRDYAWAMLARDLRGQFRGIDVRSSLPSERIATAQLRIAIEEKCRDPNFSGWEPQGDEAEGRLLDLFEDRGVPDSKLHKYYLELRDRPGRAPARMVFKAISPWLVTSDPHLVKEFQEGQFDQRLWEVYLWATFRDQGFDVEHRVAPDLIMTSPWYSFAVEATTVGPSTAGPLSKHPDPRTLDEVATFLTDYMPMKFGGPLTSKLSKVDAQGRHYWQMQGAEGLPFVLAIADFHKEAGPEMPGSMCYSQGALYSYLYGLRVTAELIDGQAVYHYEPVAQHAYNGKVIPSGFFTLPDSENVSAVLFSNAATLAKFDRIGVRAGFAPDKHKYFRVGFMYDPDPNALVPVPFKVDVSDPAYDEYWGDEVQIFHNPRSLRPLDAEAFPDATHYWLKDGELVVKTRGGAVLGSMTAIFAIGEAANIRRSDTIALTAAA
jgi:hypothetical protein